MAKTTTSSKSAKTQNKSTAKKTSTKAVAKTDKTTTKKTTAKSASTKAVTKKESAKTTSKKASSKSQEKKSNAQVKKQAEKKSTASKKTQASSKAKSANKVATKSVKKEDAPKTKKTVAEQKKSAKTTKLKFRINQKVVYPSQGVGKILELKEQKFLDQKLMYYKIYIEASDMTVMVPMEKAQELGIRPIVSATEAEKAIKSLSDDIEPITSDWKLRYQTNLDLLKKGSVEDIASIVRCLYNRSKVKELPVQERKLYDFARKLLEDEASFALGKSNKEIEELIHTKLEQTNSMPKVKHIINLDDDDDDNLMDDMDSSSRDADDDDSYDDDY